MTPEERRNPKLLNPSRKARIARGAGVDVSEVNRLVKQFEQTKKFMKQMPGMMGGKKGRRGAGVDIAEVNRLVKQFEQMKKMMKQMPGMMKKGRRGGGMFGKLPF